MIGSVIVSWFSVPFRYTLSLYDQQAAQPGMSGFISNDEMEANKNRFEQLSGMVYILSLLAFTLFPLPFLYYISVFATVCMCVIWGCSVCMSIKRRANWGHWWCTCWSREMEKKNSTALNLLSAQHPAKKSPPSLCPSPSHHTLHYTHWLIHTHTHKQKGTHV